MPSRPLLGGRSFTLPHSLRSRGSVKDVLITPVKNVMEQNTFTTAAVTDVFSVSALAAEGRGRPQCDFFRSL